MAKTLAPALEKAGLIDPKKAEELNKHDQGAYAKGERKDNLKPGRLDKHGIPVIAGNDENFFPRK